MTKHVAKKLTQQDLESKSAYDVVFFHIGWYIRRFSRGCHDVTLTFSRQNWEDLRKFDLPLSQNDVGIANVTGFASSTTAVMPIVAQVATPTVVMVAILCLQQLVGLFDVVVFEVGVLASATARWRP